MRSKKLDRMEEGHASPSPGLADQVIIRQMVAEDLPDLEWDGEYVHFRRLYAEVYESARMGQAVLWVAELPQRGLIGQLFVQLKSGRPELADGLHRAYIYGFRVRSGYRSKGIGSRLMQAAEADLVQRGFRWVTLNVGKDNPDARRLYERQGYQAVASEPGDWSYIDHRGRRQEVHEPAWRMQKQLNAPPSRSTGLR